MILFYTRSESKEVLNLEQEDSRHCLKVLRNTVNDRIRVTDGKGSLFEAVITDVSGGLVKARVIETRVLPPPRSYRLHVAIAPTKNPERFEWFLEKSAEIGIDEITPLICERSERKGIRQDRLERILLSAVKQSLSPWIPVLNQAIGFKDFMDMPASGARLIPTCDNSPVREFHTALPKGNDVLVLIGPEGDFTAAELSSAIDRGFVPVSLGDSRLRTETAGVYVTAAVNLLNRL